MGCRPDHEVVRGFRLISFEFNIVSDLPEVTSALGHLLGCFAIEPREGVATYRVHAPAEHGAPYLVTLGDDVVQRTRTIGLLIDFLLWEMNARAIRSVDDRPVLHAGAVAWDGAGIVLPAPPDSGKTTLTAGLVAAGFSYLTDEAAVIDPATLEVQPYPRPLWMDRTTLSLFDGLDERLATGIGDDVHVVPEEIREDALGGPCRVSFLIAPRYDPDLREPRLEPMSRAAGLALLARHAFNLDQQPKAYLATLGRLLENTDCYALQGAELSATVDVVARLVGKA